MMKKNLCNSQPSGRDFSELSLRKQPPSLGVTESDSDLFTDADYVIM